MAKTYKTGTRRSPLALKQAGEVLGSLRKYYPALKAEIVGMNTYGDKDKDTPISEIEGSDFFTREIDEAVLRGQSDFAVHSAKDLPDVLAQGLMVAAITESIDPFDVLVAKDNLKLAEFKPGAKIGTSSLRRKQQLKNYRQDLQIVDIRGNIFERLKLLEETDLDGIVIAAAGLLRLGLGHRIAQRIPFAVLRPHPLQGALALVTRSSDKHLIELLSVLDVKRGT